MSLCLIFLFIHSYAVSNQCHQLKLRRLYIIFMPATMCLQFFPECAFYHQQLCVVQPKGGFFLASGTLVTLIGGLVGILVLFYVGLKV